MQLCLEQTEMQKNFVIYVIRLQYYLCQFALDGWTEDRQLHVNLWHPVITAEAFL